VPAGAPGCLAFFPDDPAGTPVTGKRAHPSAHRADRLPGRRRRDAACGLPAAQRPCRGEAGPHRSRRPWHQPLPVLCGPAATASAPALAAR